MTAKKNGNGHDVDWHKIGEQYYARLVHAQATLVESEAVRDRETAAIRREIAEIERRIEERFVRIETILLRLLEVIPEAVREKIGLAQEKN